MNGNDRATQILAAGMAGLAVVAILAATLVLTLMARDRDRLAERLLPMAGFTHRRVGDSWLVAKGGRTGVGRLPTEALDDWAEQAGEGRDGGTGP